MDKERIQAGLCELGLQGQDVAVHSSLKSLKHVAGAPKTVVQALLDVCGTVLMPTFCEIGRSNPPPNDRPPQNGWNYEEYRMETADISPFNPESFDKTSELSISEMGRIAAEFLLADGTVRSRHPSVSWAANGLHAGWYVSGHAAEDPNLPLKKLKERQGYVLFLGVGLAACTAVHLAEELTGRRPFIRWILYTDGVTRRVREYGCSDAFPRLAPYVETCANRVAIGPCQAVSYRVEQLVDTLVQVIAAQPEITLCGCRGCCRCQDSVKGGPLDNAEPNNRVEATR